MKPNSNQIKAKAKELGFHLVGIAKVEGHKETNHLKTWLRKGYHGNMEWMKNPKRHHIRTCRSWVQSVISVALNYYTPHQRPEGKKYGKIARYGWGRDYHKVMSKKLKALSRWLQKQETGVEAKYYSDTGPVQEKVWAQRAGIGWIGKNGNLITREYGSWVFLGEVLTNLVLEPDKPHGEYCGTCTRCLQSCPTSAFPKPFVVDANRCIAYHTIENRGKEIPKEINLAGWVAGCDICQEVCPWNQRFAKETDVADFQPYPGNVAPLLTDLATLSEEEWSKRWTASALRRIKPQMWQRNARCNFGTADDCEAKRKQSASNRLWRPALGGS